MRISKDSIFIIRPLNCILTFVAVWAGAVISANGYISPQIILASLSAMSIAAYGYIINDIFDLKVDSINKSQRPIASGRIAARTALAIAIAAAVIGLLLSTFINYKLFMTSLAIVALLSLYTPYFKPIPYLGNLIIAAISAMAFIYGGMAVGDSSGPIFIAIFSFLYHFAREIIKDLEDREADSEAGSETQVRRTFGTGLPRLIAVITIIILIVVTFVPYFAKIYGNLYMIIVFLGVDSFLIMATLILIWTDDIAAMRKLAVMLKIPMPIGILAVLLGSFGL